MYRASLAEEEIERMTQQAEGEAQAGDGPAGALRFQPTPVHGAWLVEGVRREDDRGFFARLFCETEFAARGLETRFTQMNTSLSRRCHTLRGMHYQLPPAAEVKLVRCTAGALFDVVLDLRPDSPSFARWFGAELSAENRRMLYLPRGCAHGFLTLRDETETLYLMSDTHAPGLERGLRFDDPRFAIAWPATPVDISARDLAWPAFDPAYHGTERLRGLL
jgi:dTDP-4-dehydrorhamnose 3,5-epimerase